MKYRVVITNPEMMFEKNGRFLSLLRNQLFLRNLISIIIDEAHCVVKWGSFRPEYRELGLLRHNIPYSIPLYIASATLPPVVMRDVRRLLHIRPNPYEEIMSNDRPNVSLMVRRINYPLNSYWDLSFLVPYGWTPDQPKPPLFLFFFDSIDILQEAVEFLRSRLPPEYRHLVLPFHSQMSEEHRLQTIALMKEGKILGACASEGFGLVSFSIRIALALNLTIKKGYRRILHSSCRAVATSQSRLLHAIAEVRPCSSRPKY